jgi:AsmA family
MQQTDPTHVPEQAATPAEPSPLRRRLLYAGIILFFLFLLVFGPPLVNIGRFQRRVATAIGYSLGRPVHLDRVSLTLLPVPGFNIENLVVGEDPSFGSEPIIRANSVRATLRISSLWRHQIEFSTISFAEPSVNLVHDPNGRWNIEGILLQAARIDAAPTAQRRAGPAPRFPYIEATGARLNFKQEQEKLPFSLTDADFSLWLPDPHQWHLRIKAHPVRTDLGASDTGTIELEAVLEAAPSLAQVPLNVQGQWRGAPLGEATRVLFGHDLGWRGEMTLAANIRGTFGESAVTTRLHLSGTRPADFVPERPLTADVECFATATGLFHAFEDLRCSWPPAATPDSPAIAVTGSIPNVHQPSTASLQAGTSGISAATLLSWARTVTPGIPEDTSASGTLTGSFSFDGRWHGQLTLRDASLLPPPSAIDGSAEPESFLSGDIQLHTTALANSSVHGTSSHPPSSPSAGLILTPTPLQLGGKAPAILEGRFDASGYSLRLSGPVTQPRLDALASTLPPLGEGIQQAVSPLSTTPNPFQVDLVATRPWGGPQTWQQTSLRPPTPATPHPRHPH